MHLNKRNIAMTKRKRKNGLSHREIFGTEQDETRIHTHTHENKLSIKKVKISSVKFYLEKKKHLFIKFVRVCRFFFLLLNQCVLFYLTTGRSFSLEFDVLLIWLFFIFQAFMSLFNGL